jgi:hypothetical protein
MAISNNFSSGWSRHVPREETSFDKRLRASLNGTPLDLNDPENLTAAQIRAVAELAEREDPNVQLAAELNKTGTAFCKLHAEYVDNEANAHLMRHQLKTMGVKRPTLADFEVAYAQLRESDFLKLDKKVLRQQEDEEAQRAADAFKNRHIPTEEDRYSMSLVELRRLEDSEIKQQMQRRGEEGGW